MALTDFQYSYNGLTFGSGTDIQIQKEEGLRSLPANRGQDVNKPRAHGAFAGLNFMAERTVVLTLAVSVTKKDDFQTVVSNITKAFQPIVDPTAQKTLQFMYPGWSEPKQVTGRVTAVGFPTDLDFSFHKINALPVQIVCNDPLIYSTTLWSSASGIPSPTSGLTFDVTFNAVFGTSNSGTILVNNAGTYETAPTFTIQGPMSNPKIQLSSTGEYMKLNTVLGVNDVIVIDGNAKTVTLNGSASRLNTIATGSSWFTLPTGKSSLNVTSTDPVPVVGTITATWRDAWSWV